MKNVKRALHLDDPSNTIYFTGTQATLDGVSIVLWIVGTVIVFVTSRQGWVGPSPSVRSPWPSRWHRPSPKRQLPSDVGI